MLAPSVLVYVLLATETLHKLCSKTQNFQSRIGLNAPKKVAGMECPSRLHHSTTHQNFCLTEGRDDKHSQNTLQTTNHFAINYIERQKQR